MRGKMNSNENFQHKKTRSPNFWRRSPNLLSRYSLANPERFQVNSLSLSLSPLKHNPSILSLASPPSFPPGRRPISAALLSQSEEKFYTSSSSEVRFSLSNDLNPEFSLLNRCFLLGFNCKCHEISFFMPIS